MTPKMRTTLEQAVRGALRRTHTPGPGKPPWPVVAGEPVSANTLAALVARGFLERSEGANRHGVRVSLWTVTEAGTEALKPRERFLEHKPLYLQRNVSHGGDYTTDPSARCDELEVMRDELRYRWLKGGRGRWLEAQERRVVARRLASSVRRAA